MVYDGLFRTSGSQDNIESPFLRISSAAESCIEVSGILAVCITAVDRVNGGRENDLIVALGEAVKLGSMSSCLRGIPIALLRARVISASETSDDLAMAVSSNDIAVVGRLLGPRDVNAICLNEKVLPESLARLPLKCSLLDVAVGSGSVEMTKYLLEFHRARPTRETLKQSISIGNLELFKLMRKRLPEGELRD
jgi:hypothetical protein